MIVCVGVPDSVTVKVGVAVGLRVVVAVTVAVCVPVCEGVPVTLSVVVIEKLVLAVMVGDALFELVPE